MIEKLTYYLKKVCIKVKYLHSDILALERTEIIRDLRLGKLDVLVGINLLREGLDIYFGQESNKLKEGKDYTLTYNDAYKFTITFLHEIDADNTNRIVITYCTENTVARDDAKYKDGDKFTYTNAGKLTIREGQELSVSDSTVWYKHSFISKEAGDYDKTNHTIRWFITLNKDGTFGTLAGNNSVAAITDTLTQGASSM